MVGSIDDRYFRTLRNRARELSALARLFRRNLAADMTVLDVGANIGLSTILLARSAKFVFAFEASPRNADYLVRNLELNDISNVKVVRGAVSDTDAVVRIHEARFGAGSHVVSDSHVAGNRVPTIEVPSLTLDGMDLPAIGLMKVDVEGHEPNVLAGARKLLSRDAPLIYTEINAWCLSAFAGHSLGAVVRSLWQTFDVGRVETDGSVSELADAYEFLHDLIVRRGGLSDIVLRPKSGVQMPDLPSLTWPLPALRACAPPTHQ